MGIGQQLSTHAPATAAAKTLKQDDSARRPSSHYLRQRQAMRAPLLPVRGMAMTRGSGGDYAMLHDANTSTSNAQPRRKQTRKLVMGNLPPEAAALKRRVWDSHPGSAYKFRLDKMKRVVTPPVAIPAPLSDPMLLSHMVSGKTIPVTRLMWQQQRNLFTMKRLPNRIREGVAY